MDLSFVENKNRLSRLELENKIVQYVMTRIQNLPDQQGIRLIKSGNASYTMSNASVENGVLCNNTSTISITMPAKSPYWNNRCYFVKVRTATVNLVQNTDTRIDDDESTLVMSSDFRGYLLQFDSDYENNGDIWRLCQI